MSELHYCSFCGKRSDHVFQLIAGPSSMICDGCVGLCTDIIRDARTELAVKSAVADATTKERDRVVNRMQFELLSLGVIGIIRKSGTLHRWLAEKVRA